jgi:UDP-N-acetylmuramate--alanine ligase
MQNAVDLSGRPFHFIGIGGIGMSALAQILTERNLPVSGSDVRATNITQKLSALGAHVFNAHSGDNLNYFLENGNILPQVICSTAIQQTNPEYQAAVHLGCPIFHRSDVLSALIQEAPKSIAVAGTHGKTTTSSLIGYLLMQANLDPTIVIGGEVSAWQGNAKVGQSPYLVAEADESDGSLVKLKAHIGIVTNIELDHPDHYATLDEVVQIFHTFTDHCHQMVLCADCETIQNRIMPTAANRPWTTYSLNPQNNADYLADDVTYGADITSATLYERGQRLGELSLALLGRHNLSNALAAVAVGRLLEIPFETIASALSTFAGTRRRFELRGEAQGICFIDDYAHHPSEIRATLSSARLRTTPDSEGLSQYQRVVAVFQPHRYSRTMTFLEDFSQAFGDADCVIPMDIYSAGEARPPGVSGAGVAAAIAEHHPLVSYQETLSNVTTYLQENLKSGDLVVFLGAGDLNRIIPDLVSYFQESTPGRQAEVALR